MVNELILMALGETSRRDLSHPGAASLAPRPKESNSSLCWDRPRELGNWVVLMIACNWLEELFEAVES